MSANASDVGGSTPEGGGYPSDDGTRRSVVVALFECDDEIPKLTRTAGKAATTIEVMAEEAVVVAKDAAGDLVIVGSDHSVGRSFAKWTAKMAILSTLGLKGIIATAAAGVEVSAAARSRDYGPEVVEEDLTALTDQMQPGWVAVIAVYPDKRVDKAVKIFQKAKARRVWVAGEDAIAAVVAEQGIAGPE